MNVHDRQLNFMTFQSWKMKYFNSMTFQISHDPYEPCYVILGWWSLTAGGRTKSTVFKQCKSSVKPTHLVLLNRGHFSPLKKVGKKKIPSAFL